MKPCVHFDIGEGCLLNHKDSCPHYSPYETLKVKYKNWQGKVGIRTIVPARVYYGHTDYHKEDQWLMEVFDIDKDAPRTYALMDILDFIKEG